MEHTTSTCKSTSHPPKSRKQRAQQDGEKWQQTLALPLPVPFIIHQPKQKTLKKTQHHMSGTTKEFLDLSLLLSHTNHHMAATTGTGTAEGSQLCHLLQPTDQNPEELPPLRWTPAS